MKQHFDPTGEGSNYKMVAVFDRRGAAEDAMRTVVDGTPLQPTQLDLLGPDSDHKNRKLLPESRGIWRTLVRAHAGFGLLGALSGVALFLLLNRFGVPFVSQNPTAALLLAIHVFTMLGLMAGGLFTLRPDQLPYIRLAREALEQGRSVLVVHAGSSDELQNARTILQQSAMRAVSTI